MCISSPYHSKYAYRPPTAQNTFIASSTASNAPRGAVPPPLRTYALKKTLWEGIPLIVPGPSCRQLDLYSNTKSDIGLIMLTSHEWNLILKKEERKKKYSYSNRRNAGISFFWSQLKFKTNKKEGLIEQQILIISITRNEIENELQPYQIEGQHFIVKYITTGLTKKH